MIPFENNSEQNSAKHTSDAPLNAQAQTAYIVLDVLLRPAYISDDALALVNLVHADEAERQLETLLGLTSHEEVTILKSLLSQAVHDGRTLWPRRIIFHLKSGTNVTLRIRPGAAPTTQGRHLLELIPEAAVETQAPSQAAQTQRMKSAMKTLPAGITLVNTQGVIEHVNNAAEQILGGYEENLWGRSFEAVFELYEAESGEPLPSLMEEVRRTGLPISRSEGVELVAQNGARKQVAIDCVPLLGASGIFLGATLLITDITGEQSRQRHQHFQSQMDTTALLCAGIAHDLSNFLTSIMGNLSLLRSRIENKEGKGSEQSQQPAMDASETAAMLSAAERSSQRAKLITNRLFTLSKAQTPEKHALSLEPIIADAATFLFSGEKYTCSVNMAPHVWTLEADEAQLTQAIHNLIINAQESMEAGGNISITLTNCKKVWDKGAHLPNGEYVEIAIADTGCGMTPQQQARIFEPAYSTKEGSHGLGLSTAYALIDQHGGRIEVSSELGAGTTFRCYLPATPGITPMNANGSVAPFETATSAASPNGSAPANRSGSAAESTETAARAGRLLIVEDEEVVQDILADMLTHLGYTYSFASNGEQAAMACIRAAEQNIPYAGALIDLNVRTGSGGPDALRAIRKTAPHMPAVVTSGYAHDEHLHHAKDYGFAHALAKPFTLEALDKALRKLA